MHKRVSDATFYKLFQIHHFHRSYSQHSVKLISPKWSVYTMSLIIKGGVDVAVPILLNPHLLKSGNLTSIKNSQNMPGKQPLIISIRCHVMSLIGKITWKLYIKNGILLPIACLKCLTQKRPIVGHKGNLMHIIWTCKCLTSFWNSVFSLISQVTRIITKPVGHFALLGLSIHDFPKQFRTIVLHILFAAQFTNKWKQTPNISEVMQRVNIQRFHE